MKSKLLIGLMALSLSSASLAETPEEKGLRIAQETDNFDKGFIDSTSDMVMTLKNRSGNTSSRVLSIKTLEGTNSGDKSLSIFNEPVDVKGAKMLTFSHGLKPDDQWIYLPALKRVKRISSRNKSGPFMGSEFAFEDLGSQEVEKYTYRYLRDEPCGEGNRMSCYVIERKPAYQYSGYTRQVTWVDKAGYRLPKVVFYDRKNTLLKTSTATGFKQYLGKYWRPTTMHMVNHLSGKSTRLQFSNYRFKTNLSSRDFHNKTLAR